MKRSIKGYLGLALLGLQITSCGGVREEARVATAVQTMMVLAVEAAIRYNIDNISAGTGPLDCAGGGTYEPSGAALNNFIDFITGRTNTAQVSGQFVFDNCEIPLCDSYIVLNGSADFALETEISSSQRKLLLTFASSDAEQVESEGIINGEPQFKYKMEVDVSSKSLGNINIIEATPATPLNYEGKVYRAAKLRELARGC
jgi:hypothetical protein